MTKIRSALYYLVAIHGVALLILSAIRIVLLLTNTNSLEGESIPLTWVFSALIRGLWFDNVIVCYISALPLVVLSVLGLFNMLNKAIIGAVNSFYIVLIGLVIAISAADIPYFNYFFKHLNASIFNWKEEGGNALAMMLQESSYYAYFCLFFICFGLFVFVVLFCGRKAVKNATQSLSPKKYAVYIPICLVLVSLCFLGIRGRFGYNPIKTSQAYFCNNSFLNQLGLNPTFFLMRNIIENSKKHVSIHNLMDEQKAISFAMHQLGALPIDASQSPIARYVDGVGETKKINVVYILMESMSADLLRAKEGKLTPFLNQLITQSYYFTNFYSAGTHTNHGIMATLYGLPSLFDKNMMKDVHIPLCEGMPNILQKRGYKTLFFATHETQYDNMNAFLLENGIDRMYGEEDYPDQKVVSGFGVQDDYLFEFAVNKLTETSKNKAPFFASILTISNHPPYIVPDRFKSISDNPQEQVVAFADDAIARFMERAKKEEWYNNTVFVLLADHGKIVGTPTYDMPLSYNHIPLIIYSPMFADAPKTYSQLGGQVDVSPTILGLLGYSYTNNTLGVDLLKTMRPYMYYTSDDMMGCLSDKYLYIYNPANRAEWLYDYKNNKPASELDMHKALADSMKNYAASMLITTDYMLRKKLTRTKN